ncbi:MAG TPA: hypothetical protein VL463_01320 [Kofleriaceae bacterium]|nr:hypothetical protein [Kofleriaceae bacterium]
MLAPFELDWCGGASAARLRRRRPGIDELPWESLHAETLDDATLAAARTTWTEGAFSEYASAAAFAALAGALLEAGAPIDLTAMAGDFVVDEITHVELNARLAATIGGAAPHLVDLDKLAPPRTDHPAIARAAALAIKICVVGESLSVPVLATAARVATQPLARAVLARIAHDEGPHARLGAHVLAWAGDRLDPFRDPLRDIARRALAAYAPLWRRRPPPPNPSTRALGILDGADHARVLRRAVRARVVPALAVAHLAPDPGWIDELLGDDVDAPRAA